MSTSEPSQESVGIAERSTVIFLWPRGHGLGYAVDICSSNSSTSLMDSRELFEGTAVLTK